MRMNSSRAYPWFLRCSRKALYSLKGSAYYNKIDIAGTKRYLSQSMSLIPLCSIKAAMTHDDDDTSVSIR